jgi:hypothetical protein
MNSRLKTVHVATMLSTDLALRETARTLILYIDGLPDPEIVLDFSHVRTVTRSFAHEYNMRKRDARKRIHEKNIAENVAKMFAVANASRAPHSKSQIDFSGIPIVNI